jgi:hypothetical protein
MSQARVRRDPIMAALFNLLTAGMSASFYATTANGSPVLTGVSALAGPLWYGFPLFGPGIANGAYIQSVDAAGNITMTLPAIADSASEVLVTSGIQTSGRRLIPWAEVAAQPALFLRRIGGEFLPRRPRLPGRVEIEAEIWLYSAGGDNPDMPPEAPLNALVDAVAELLEPKGAQESQTLGVPPLVTHCWLEGKEADYPGDLGGSAIAVLPVKILAPGVSPTGGPMTG